MQSTPPTRFFQYASRLRAPGSNTAIPTIAIPVAVAFAVAPLWGALPVVPRDGVDVIA
jgi:hypothetical protein